MIRFNCHLCRKEYPECGVGKTNQIPGNRKDTECCLFEPGGEKPFGSAGVSYNMLGGTAKVRHKVQHPWSCKFRHGVHVFSILEDLFEDFFVLESGGMNSARIIECKGGEHFDVTLYPNVIVVYPTSNTHMEASEKLLKIFTLHGGVVEDG